MLNNNKLLASSWCRDLGVFVHINPEAEAQRSYAHALSLSCNLTLPEWPYLGRLRVIVKEKPLNLEKPTFSVLSVLLLIYGIKNSGIGRRLLCLSYELRKSTEHETQQP